MAFDDRLQLRVETKIARNEVLKDVPAEAAPLAGRLWARRADLEKWLAADPDRPQLLVADPERALSEAFPDLTLPATLPGSELKKQILQFVALERVELELGQRDTTTAEAVTLFGQLLGRVAAGTTTPEQIAADPEGAVQAAAAGGASAEIMGRVVAALRFVLNLPAPVPVIVDGGRIRIPLEEFGARRRRTPG